MFVLTQGFKQYWIVGRYLGVALNSLSLLHSCNRFLYIVFRSLSNEIN